MGFDETLESVMKDTNFARGASPPGLSPLNWGIDRMAFRIELGKYTGKILKVARKNRALDQNRKELRTWRNVQGTQYEKYFCPILLGASDTNTYQYVVMEPADTPVSSHEERRQVIETLEEQGLPVSDGSRGNFGYYNRNVVFIDYPWGKF